MKDPEDFEEYVFACQEELQEAKASWFARNWLRARGLTDETVRSYLLGYDWERQAVTIPYLNALGEVRSLRWRNLKDHRQPKYMQPKGEHLHLFHVTNTNKPKVWVAEGEFDTMILNQMGMPAVGIPGANAFREEWAYLFAYCDQVTVVFDGDEAGQDAARNLTHRLGPFVDKLRMIRIPMGKDVNDLYIEDRKALLDLIG